MSIKDVVFLQTAHAADDDRVYYHQAATLAAAGMQPHIIAFHSNFVNDGMVTVLSAENQTLKSKMQTVCAELARLAPKTIICDTPIAIKTAYNYKKNSKNRSKIIYDITEWYPSKKNLRSDTVFKKIAKALVMPLYNFLSTTHSDGLIFGETFKAKPYKTLFPSKPSIMLPYCPDIKYVDCNPLSDIGEKIRLLYAGPLTEEKGFCRVLKVAAALAEKLHKLEVTLNIITEKETDIALEKPDNLNIAIYPWMPFETFCSKAADNDLFLDLRDTDFENQRCMPIKLYYYMAMGRPVIYSDLKAIRVDCPEIQSFGRLVNPDDTEDIVKLIVSYITDHDLYARHATNARKLAVEKYNWENNRTRFVEFIKSLWA